MPTPLRVCIAGGGPGALALAHTLLRSGVHANVRVFERASTYSPSAGGGFGLAFNGQSVLRALGLWGRVEPLVLPLMNWAICSATPSITPVREWRNIPTMSMPDGSAALSGALRAEVLGEMQRALPPGTVELGAEVVGVTNGDASRPARVRIARPRSGEGKGEEEEAEFDIVVAADGIRSRIRDLVVDPTPPAYSGAQIYYGVAAGPLLESHEWSGVKGGVSAPSGWTVQALGLGDSFISVGCKVHHTAAAFPGLLPASLPGGTNAVYYALVRHCPEKDAGEESWEAQGGRVAVVGGPQSVGDAPGPSPHAGNTTDEHKDRLWHELGRRQWGPFARDLVEATPSGRLLRFKMYSRKPIATWHKGRVALLGDAAHAPLPTVGQGLNMALEDGFCLGTEIAEAFRGPAGSGAAGGVVIPHADVQRRASTAFTSYQLARHDKTSRMVQLSRLLLLLESGVETPWIGRLRTRLVAAGMEGTFDALRKQIEERPVVNEESLRKLRGGHL